MGQTFPRTVFIFIFVHALRFTCFVRLEKHRGLSHVDFEILHFESMTLGQVPTENAGLVGRKRCLLRLECKATWW